MGISIRRIAVFLDRDGVINSHCGTDKFGNPESPLRFEDFQIFPFVGDSIKKINALGFIVLIATNQPAVAKGKMTLDVLNKMHTALLDKVLKAGGRIDKIYTCLHHPDPKQVVNLHLLKECECRKPKPGMLLRAASEFNIDLKRSWMIGDSWRDITAGKSAKCKTILIAPSAQNSAMCSPDATAKNLEEAVKIIEKEKIK